MKPRYRREALQILQSENQRAVHHPVDQEAMLAGIDIRRLLAVV
jgi:hypothetical protein